MKNCDDSSDKVCVAKVYWKFKDNTLKLKSGGMTVIRDSNRTGTLRDGSRVIYDEGLKAWIIPEEVAQGERIIGRGEIREVAKDRRPRQINRWSIKFSNDYGKWGVWSPDGRLLEEFDRKADAERFATNNLDWVKKSSDEFEFDEEKALKKGFEEARAKGKLFDLNAWKKKREQDRVNASMHYGVSSPRVPAGKFFKTIEEAKAYMEERMRKGDSQAGIFERQTEADDFLQEPLRAGTRKEYEEHRQKVEGKAYGPIRLPEYEFEGRKWTLDERLNELRSVRDSSGERALPIFLQGEEAKQKINEMRRKGFKTLYEPD
jgi:hypothetical protein